MKKVIIACNICETEEGDMVDKMWGLSFVEVDGRTGMNFSEKPDQVDIHICDVCLKCIEGLRGNTRSE